MVIGIYLLILSIFLAIPIAIGLASPIGMVLDQRRFMWYGILFATAIAGLVSFIAPTPEMDLYRYWAVIGGLESAPFGGAVSSLLSGEDPLSYVAMYLVAGRFGVQAIASFAAFVGYVAYFALISDFMRVQTLSASKLSFILAYFLLSYHLINTVSGFRYGVGVAIFVMGIYLATIRARPIFGVALMAVSCFFHSSLVLFSILLLGLWVVSKLPFLVQSACIVLVAGSVSVMASLSSGISRFPTFSFVSSRAEVYLAGYSPYGFWFAFQLISGILVVASLLPFVLRRSKGFEGLFWRFSFVVPLVGVVNIANFDIATRMFTVSRVLFVFALIECLSSARVSRVVRVGIVATAVFVACGMAYNQWSALSQVGFLQIVESHAFRISFFG